jgi:cell wall assembly regulator SMI1
MNTIYQLFTNWIAEIKKNVPENNPYFNLASGISDSEIQAHKTLEDDIEIPIELIQLYQIHNVNYDPVTSAFQISTDQFEYDIIPFKKIKEHWEDIQDLQFGDDIAPSDLENYSEKVKANDYANPGWIPFADGRNGDYLLFDTDPSELGTYGQIIELQNETWERIVVANSLEEMFQKQIEILQAGNLKMFEFILGNTKETSTDFMPNSELKNLLQTVKYSTIKDRMPEDSWTRNEYEKNPENDPDILYYKGDLKIDYIDLSEPLIDYECRNEDYELYLRDQAAMMIFIDGNLFVNNLFSSNEDGAFGLVVTGSINAKNMIVGGGEIHVMEDLNITDLLWGHYNHGELNVGSEIFARVILITDQYGFDEENTSYTSEYYFNEESEDYEDDHEYYVELAEALFEPQYLDYAIDTISEEDYEEIYGWASLLQRSTIIESLKENQSLLKTKFEHPEPNPKSQKDKIKLSLKELVPICIENKDKKNKLYSLIDSFEIDDEYLENPQELLDAICEHLDTEWPNIFLVIDHKLSVDDVAFNLEKTVKENFDVHDFKLPKNEDYKGIPYLLSDVWVDFENALRLINKEFQLTFLKTDTDSYFVVLHKEIEKWGVQRILKDLGFESYFHKKAFLEEHNHKNVPILFENKKLILENYNRFFENYNEFYYDEVNIVLPLSRANVYVNKPHKRASDGAEVPQNIFFLLEDGAEVYVWIAPKKMMQKLFSKSDSFEILYKNTQANSYQFKAIQDIPEALESFKPIWAEFLTHVERSQYYWKQLIQTATPERVRNILNLDVVKNKYNDSEDSDKMPWLAKFNLAFDFTPENYIAFRVSKEIESSTEFDVCNFYYDAFTDNDYRYRYLSSQLDATKDFYSAGNTAIRFLDYQLIKKATLFFTKAEKLTHKDNEKYLKKEAKKALKAENELKFKQNRINNYHVVKPFEKIEIEGINFTLKDRKEAAEIVKICTDFAQNEIYDTFEMALIESDEDNHKSFFLVAEDEIIAEKLKLETYPTEQEDCYILGYIFTKPLKINKYIEAYDLEFSPPIICLDHAIIGSLILSGNTHYFHKNLYATTIYGEYNHGNLIVKGRTEADLIIADDFGMQFSEVAMNASISSDRDIQVMNDLSALELEILQEMNYLPGTHNAEHCIKDELIYKDENEFRFKGGFCADKYQLQEGEQDFYTILRKGESLIDVAKITAKHTDFIQNAFAKTDSLFKKLAALNSLSINEIHYEYPNENYTHLMYFYQETEEFYIIGYWNLWYHLSIAVCIHKSNQTDKHSLTVFYWNKENNEVRYQYGSEMEENTYYKNICQKIFFEGLEMLENKD